jgi:hypothetical protein
MTAFAASESLHRFEVQEFGQLTDLFVLSPSVVNWKVFSELLFDSSTNFDSLRLLLERLVGIDHGFIFVLLITSQHFRSSAQLEQERFAKMLAEVLNLSPISRKLALIRMTR